MNHGHRSTCIIIFSASILLWHIPLFLTKPHQPMDDFSWIYRYCFGYGFVFCYFPLLAPFNFFFHVYLVQLLLGKRSHLFCANENAFCKIKMLLLQHVQWAFHVISLLLFGLFVCLVCARKDEKRLKTTKANGYNEKTKTHKILPHKIFGRYNEPILKSHPNWLNRSDYHSILPN